MVLETHLSSDISTDPLVTSIAEELTNIINTINNYRTDWYNILTNLLKIKNIVEESENPQVKHDYMRHNQLGAVKLETR